MSSTQIGFVKHANNVHAHFSFQDLINQHDVTITLANEEVIRLRKDFHERQQSKSSKSSSKHRRDSSSSSKDKDSKEREREKDKDKDKDKDKEKRETVGGGVGKSPKDTSETQVDESDSTTDLTTESESSHAASKPAMQIDFSDLSTLNDEEVVSIRDRAISARRKVHKLTVSAVTARWSFEEGIKRPYFHVKPLERAQLKNWKDYLDFEIEKGDRERVLVFVRKVPNRLCFV